MKCSLPKNELLAHATRAARIVNNNAHIPSQRGVRLEAKKGMLIFTSTNLEMGVMSECAAHVDEDGVCIVPAKTFIDSLKFTSGAEVTLTVQGSVVTIKTTHGVSKIPLLPLEEFPPISTHTTDVVHEIPVSVWTQGVQSVLYAVSQSSIKPELASVFVSQQDTNLVFVATDSFRLAEKKILLQTEDDIPNTLIPAKNVHELQNLLTEFPEEKGHFYFDDDQLSIKLSNVYVSTRLITGTFPDYAKIIPKEATTTVTMLTEDLDTVFKKASIFSDTTRQVSIEVVPEHKQCLIRAKNGTVGEMEEVVPATIEGVSIGINVSGKYVSDCLQSITRDSVTLQFAGVGRPILIKSVGDPSYLYLVMPMNK
jgi:DNA polymerase-3 subunit beta